MKMGCVEKIGGCFLNYFTPVVLMAGGEQIEKIFFNRGDHIFNMPDADRCRFQQKVNLAVAAGQNKNL